MKNVERRVDMRGDRSPMEYLLALPGSRSMTLLPAPVSNGMRYLEANDDGA